MTTTDSSSSLRLFLAAPVDPLLSAQLHDSLVISRDMLPALRPVPVTNMHLTLAFIGNYPEQQLQQTLLPALQQALQEARPGRVYLRQVTGFPRADQASCLVAEGNPSPTLLQLHHLLQQTLAPIVDSPQDNQPGLWRPHITLARFLNTPEDPVVATPWLQELPVSEVVLYRSNTTSHGPVYQALQSWSLN
ncbi:MAG: RNA 2',3'-cyclic phosphodiesterase [Halomonadaceae bacterium]|nr:MAG: RNA 2',3'-cyclic phosphodiesterase [Halomonadaceae bacterium]